MVFFKSKVFFLYIIKLAVDDESTDNEADGNGELEDNQNITEPERLPRIEGKSPFRKIAINEDPCLQTG